MAKSQVTCFHCGARFVRENREINRKARLGKPHFCSSTCAARHNADLTRAKEVVLTCPCGNRFKSTTKAKAAIHCSRSCASRFSMSGERRESQRLSGINQANNLLSPVEVLKRREAWKYSALREVLGERPHEFEFELEGYVFDLALLDTGTLVEFDGPYHGGTKQGERDLVKEAVAERNEFVVIRRPVLPAVTIDPITLEGL